MLTCDACGHEIESLECPECNEHNPKDARYCCYCGMKIISADGDDGMIPDGDPYDMDNRVLCSDDACIGIIGENGVCTECGRTYKQED